MKNLIFASMLVAISAPVLAADVNVSLSIGQPGYYGQIDIGDYPRPQLIYRQPMMVERVTVDRAPIYLRVPPGHAKNWRKHCRKYNACGERVYFVQDNWYQREYVPRYQERHGNRHGDHRDHNRYERREEHRDQQREQHHDQHRDRHSDDDRGDNKKDHGRGRD